MGNELKLKLSTKEVTFGDLDFLKEIGVLDALFDGNEEALTKKRIEISVSPKQRCKLLGILYDNDFSDVNIEGLPSNIIEQGLDFFFIKSRLPLKKYGLLKKISTPTTNRETRTNTSTKE